MHYHDNIEYRDILTHNNYCHQLFLISPIPSCAETHLACEAMRGFVFSWPLFFASTIHVTSITYELIEGSSKLVTYNSQGMRVAGGISWWMQSEPVQVSKHDKLYHC